MTTATKEHVWLEWCPACKRKHYMSNQKCPSCGVHYIPQPASEAVAASCGGPGPGECDGCEAYRGRY